MAKHIRLDYSNMIAKRKIYGDPFEEHDARRMPELAILAEQSTGPRTEVFVDGKLVRSCWFIDTEAGVVASYEVIHEDGRRTGTINGPKDGFKRFIPGPIADNTCEPIDVTAQTPYSECTYSPEDFPGRRVICTPGEVMYEVHRGNVEIRDRDTGETLYGQRFE